MTSMLYIVFVSALFDYKQSFKCPGRFHTFTDGFKCLQNKIKDHETKCTT